MRDKLGGTTVYKPANVLIEHLGSDTPKLTDQKDGVTHTVICDYVAASDIYHLSRALIAYYEDNMEELMDSYSQNCLQRVWKVGRFSWWLTTIMHRFPDQNIFDRGIQLAELDYLTGPNAAQ